MTINDSAAFLPGSRWAAYQKLEERVAAGECVIAELRNHLAITRGQVAALTGRLVIAEAEADLRVEATDEPTAVDRRLAALEEYWLHRA